MNADLRDRWLARANDRIAAAGMRAGSARTAVVELLAREGQCLLTVQEIIDRLPRSGPGSSSSVYRAVDELLALGLIRRLNDHGDGAARYEIADPDRHHHHFVDERDGHVEPFTDPEVEAAIHAAARRLDVDLSGHELVLRGTRRAR